MTVLPLMKHWMRPGGALPFSEVGVTWLVKPWNNLWYHTTQAWHLGRARNLAKLQYRSKIPDINIWTILNTKPSISKVSGLASISVRYVTSILKVCTSSWISKSLLACFNSKFNIKASSGPEMKKHWYWRSVLRYQSTRYRRIFDIEVQIHISISKNSRYWSSNLGPAAAPASSWFLISIDVLC
jgi:hypothetical protein